MELSIKKQIELLKHRFPVPISAGLKCHRNLDGKPASCCQSVVTVMQSAVAAAASTGGASGVIGYFTKNFSWGCFPAEYYCECMEHSSDLYCTATMLVGLESLSIYRSLCPAPVPLALVAVDAIFILCRSCVADNARAIANARKSETAGRVHDSWLLADTCLHHLVGIIDCTSALTLCDYDARMLCQQGSEDVTVQLAAIRVSLWSGRAGREGSAHLSARSAPSGAHSIHNVTWNSIILPLDQWVDVRREAPTSALSLRRQVELLGSVYPGPSPQPQLPAAGLNGAKRRTDATLGAPPAKVPRLIHSESAEQASQGVEATSAAAQSLTVLISGVFMSSNPCPGVGVARALRAHYGATAGLQLVALDNCSFSDPVFDAFIPASDDAGAADGSMLGDMSAEEYWAGISSQLALATQKYGPIFYIPVSRCCCIDPLCYPISLT
jgi:hypothetical protein